MNVWQPCTTQTHTTCDVIAQRQRISINGISRIRRFTAVKRMYFTKNNTAMSSPPLGRQNCSINNKTYDRLTKSIHKWILCKQPKNSNENSIREMHFKCPVQRRRSLGRIMWRRQQRLLSEQIYIYIWYDIIGLETQHHPQWICCVCCVVVAVSS